MKIKKGLVLMGIIFLVLNNSGNKAMAQVSAGVSVSYQNFYDALSPYGTWIDYPSYGHVWHPKLKEDFRPYLTNGNWDYSTDGWMWMSNYDWGWAPFHYGRWMYDDSYGWLWIPGYVWSPAWVTWGSFDDYYGWAPIMPQVNVGIAFNAWRPAAFYWNMVRRDHICDLDIFNRVEKRDVVNNYANHISVIGNFGTTHMHNQQYSKGPDVSEVEKFTHRTITPASLHEINNSGISRHQGNEIQVYRPTVAMPQPREFRRVDNNQANPVHDDRDRISTERIQQNQNIDRLPMQKAPESAFGRSGVGEVRRHR